ncbi:hypothetical protein BC938DRAFT_477714 [Jimgerdemannia flammicorona]|uniref:Uncharacterized protein n=1 Tax=Jimgerdemannia flammicorona TaxID=994334 RepID=A0A433P843_9FUNG|nr:hypothetical protein BC938DRAFT_477714 [Jimgerdemannia flammicorona]
MTMTLTSILCLLAAFNAAALAQINPSQLGDFGFLYNLTLSTTTFDRNTNLSIHYSVLTTPGSVGTEDLGFHLYPAANNTAHYQNYPVNLGGVEFKWNNSDGNIVPVPMEYVIEESSWAHAIPSGIYYASISPTPFSPPPTDPDDRHRHGHQWEPRNLREQNPDHQHHRDC